MKLYIILLEFLIVATVSAKNLRSHRSLRKGESKGGGGRKKTGTGSYGVFDCSDPPPGCCCPNGRNPSCVPEICNPKESREDFGPGSQYYTAGQTQMYIDGKIMVGRYIDGKFVPSHPYNSSFNVYVDGVIGRYIDGEFVQVGSYPSGEPDDESKQGPREDAHGCRSPKIAPFPHNGDVAWNGIGDAPSCKQKCDCHAPGACMAMESSNTGICVDKSATNGKWKGWTELP